MPVIFIEKEKNRAFALRTAKQEPGMAPYFSSLRYPAGKVRSVHGRSVLGRATLNHVYADVKGNIGWAPGG
jgi:penicillin amidase